MTLPTLTPAEAAHSRALQQHIAKNIQNSGGWIDFSRFMEMALYTPNLGYYSNATPKFGATGDFVTAPELSPLFARTLAKQVEQVLHHTGGDILEFGAGTGQLAAQLLLSLDQHAALPRNYQILELSSHLRAMQQQTFKKTLPESLLTRIHWLETLPEDFCGLMLANEVLDALPAHVVEWVPAGYLEHGITLNGRALDWQARPLTNPVLLQAVQSLNVTPPMLSEISLAAPAWIATLAKILTHGALLCIDYGFTRQEYYHPQRQSGTLMCHFRHYAHHDPLINLGLQDISVHVDFSRLAEAAELNGLTVAGFTRQTQFLIHCGITDLLLQTDPQDLAHYLPLASAAQKLLSPAEMGDIFKVMALTKGNMPALLGFPE